MALSARYPKATDSFPSSIDGNWTNGPGNSDPMSWISSGNIRNSSTSVDCAMCYTGVSFGDNQYAKTVMGALSGGTYGGIWSVVRMNPANGACYMGQVRVSGADPRFYIFEIDSSFGGTVLASAGAAAGFSAGDFSVMEASGTTLELYAAIAGGAETSRVTTTDGTWTSGSTGCGVNNDSTGFQITSWEGGDDEPPGPTITDQPDDITRYTGQTASFTVAATGTGTLTYQWERSTNGGGSWSNVSGGSGATSTTYTTDALGFVENGYLYRCVVTDDVDSTNSNGARLTLISAASLSWFRA